VITGYTVGKNSVSDAEMLKNRLSMIQNKMNVTGVYVDGSYFISTKEPGKMLPANG